MEDDNQKLIEQQQIEDVIDPENLESVSSSSSSSSTLMRESDNLLFTVRVMPGTIMHIKIEPEERLTEEATTWCISTLLIHNGQHYTSIIRNFSVNPEIVRTLELIHEPSAVNDMLPVMLMPQELPRNPSTSLARLLCSSNVQPMEVVHLIDAYCRDVLTMARRINNMFEPSDDDAVDLSTLMSNTEHISHALQKMLIYVEHTLGDLAINEDVVNNRSQCDDGDDNDDDDEVVKNDNDNNDDNNDDSDSDIDSDVNIERDNINARLLHDVDGFDESQFKCDDDISPSVSEAGQQHDDTMSLDEPDFYGFPSQHWSMTSSEDGNERQIDDESWESDFEDQDAIDTNMVRYLRDHASGLISRLNAEWVIATNHTLPPPNIEWDLGSCNSLGELDDIWSELSYNIDDLDGWQHNEDRSFETALSRPFRRLIGEILPLTAQQERQTYQQFIDFSDLRSEPTQRLRESIYDYEPLEPMPSFAHWRPQENLHTASNYLRSGYSYNDSPPLCQCVDELGIPPRRTDCLERNLARLRQNLSLLESDLEPDTEMASEVDSKKQLELNEEIECNEISNDDKIIPLELYIQQTDELIAQIRARL